MRLALRWKAGILNLLESLRCFPTSTKREFLQQHPLPAFMETACTYLFGFTEWWCWLLSPSHIIPACSGLCYCLCKYSCKLVICTFFFFLFVVHTLLGTSKMVSSMHFEGYFPNFTAPRGGIHSEAVMPWPCCPCGVPRYCSAGDWGRGGCPCSWQGWGFKVPSNPDPSGFFFLSFISYCCRYCQLSVGFSVNIVAPLRYLQHVWSLLPVYLKSECVWYFWRTWEAWMLHPKLLFNEAGSRALNGEGIHTEHKYIWCVRGFWTLCGSTS